MRHLMILGLAALSEARSFPFVARRDASAIATTTMSEFPIFEGQFSKAGALVVTVEPTAQKLTIEYNFDVAKWKATHLGVGCTLADLDGYTGTGQMKDWASDASLRSWGGQHDLTNAIYDKYELTIGTDIACPDNKYVILAHGASDQTSWACTSWDPNAPTDKPDKFGACTCNYADGASKNNERWLYCAEAPKEDGSGNTNDVDPCLTMDCSGNTHCDSLSGTCVCNAGFTGDRKICCDDTTHDFMFDAAGQPVCDPNECKTGGHECHEHATCENTLDGYTCKCNQGYEDRPLTAPPPGRLCCDSTNNYHPMANPSTNNYECDLNECEADKDNNCHEHATCNNTFGGFSCTCLPTFADKSDGKGTTCECPENHKLASTGTPRCVPAYVDQCSLYGQYNPAGTVRLSDWLVPESRRGLDLSVKIDTTKLGIHITEVHVAAACGQMHIPKAGYPTPGMFTKMCTGTPTLTGCVGAATTVKATTAELTLPTVAGLKCPGDVLTVVVHYVLANGETAFGCGECLGTGSKQTCSSKYSYSNNRWAYFMTYTLNSL